MCVKTVIYIGPTDKIKISHIKAIFHTQIS